MFPLFGLEPLVQMFQHLKRHERVVAKALSVPLPAGIVVQDAKSSYNMEYARNTRTIVSSASAVKGVPSTSE
jgi:hypothetical protein